MIARVGYSHHDYLVGCGTDFIGISILDIFPLLSYHMPYPDMITSEGTTLFSIHLTGYIRYTQPVGAPFFFRYSWSAVAGHPRSPLAAFDGFLVLAAYFVYLYFCLMRCILCILDFGSCIFAALHL